MRVRELPPREIAYTIYNAVERKDIILNAQLFYVGVTASVCAGALSRWAHAHTRKRAIIVYVFALMFFNTTNKIISNRVCLISLAIKIILILLFYIFSFVDFFLYWKLGWNGILRGTHCERNSMDFFLLVQHNKDNWKWKSFSHCFSSLALTIERVQNELPFFSLLFPFRE